MRALALVTLFATAANAAPIHELGPATTKAIKAVLDKGLEFQEPLADRTLCEVQFIGCA